MMYYGETICQRSLKNGNPCKNKAYWGCDKAYLCGVHSRRLEDRVQLQKNPNAEKIKQDIIDSHLSGVLRTVKDNMMNITPGLVTIRRMNLLRSIKFVEGYLPVFPNFRHNDRKDGFCCSSLSPMNLGPVIINQSINTPEDYDTCNSEIKEDLVQYMDEDGMIHINKAQSIENYHHGSKIFSIDLNESGQVGCKTMLDIINFYNDPVPHRNKYTKKELAKLTKSDTNTPLYSVQFISGKMYTFSCLESRYFYCHQYEILTARNDDLFELKKKINQGYNLCIYGGRGYEPGDVYECYNDVSRPFGHELVLYCLLIIEDKCDYPWNVYHRENMHLYKKFECKI